IVVGGGILGSLAAWRASARGLSVVLVEQHRPGHAAGSSHGASRLLTRCLGRPAEARLAGVSLPRWRELEELAGERLVHPTATLHVSCQDLEEYRRNLEDTAVPHELLHHGLLERRFPEFQVPKDASALYVTDGAVLAASRCLVAAWRLCERRDVRLFVDSPVDFLDLEYDRPTAVGADTAYRGRSLLVAAGAWTGSLVPDLGIRVHRQQFHLYEPQESERFKLGEFPGFTLEHEGESLHGHPVFDGAGLRVWRRQEEAGVPGVCLPDPEEHRRVEDLLWRYLPRARGPSLSAYAAVSTAEFLLGHHPLRDDVVIVVGQHEHGFGLAPGMAEVAVDLASRVEPGIPVEGFAPGARPGPQGCGSPT
ncbi:MAG: FAD-dependent oxidoreductase, partial [Armatimonadetes bacterium]|nr:FAD-dependent oxidoreductase [Armatimonadota bacterium]